MVGGMVGGLTDWWPNRWIRLWVHRFLGLTYGSGRGSMDSEGWVDRLIGGLVRAGRWIDLFVDWTVLRMMGPSRVSDRIDEEARGWRSLSFPPFVVVVIVFQRSRSPAWCSSFTAVTQRMPSCRRVLVVTYNYQL